MDEAYKKEAAYIAATPLNDEGGEGWGQDEKDMARMGKKQEFQRTFNWISSIGFTSCTMDKSTAPKHYSLETNFIAPRT